MPAKIAVMAPGSSESGFRSRIPLLLLSLGSMLFLWNVFLTSRQYLTARRMDKLALDQESLLSILARSPENSRSEPHDVSQEKFADGSEFSWIIEDLLRAKSPDITNRRMKRSVNGTKRTTKSRKGRKLIPRKHKKFFGAHFGAHVDADAIRRQEIEGNASTLGHYTNYGFKPTNIIYNIWKEEDYTNTRVFRHNKKSGKVTVRKEGLYLIYGQIVFHGAFVRRSFGIHINDETLPFVEAIAYERYFNTGNIENEEISASKPFSRQRRDSPNLGYSQCNTMAVVYLKRGDMVFLKSTEKAKTIIAEKYLTFWGMALL